MPARVLDQIWKGITHNPDWRVISAVLENRFTASLLLWIILVPTAAKALELVPQTTSVSPFGADPEITLTLELPFNWYVLYFGGLALLIARLIYIWFCPKLIRLTTDAGEATKRGYTVRYLIDSTIDFFREYFAFGKVNDKELDAAVRIARQLRVNADPLLAAKVINYSNRHGIGEDFYSIFSEVKMTYSHEKGAYLLGKRPDAILIEREQLFRTLFWDLDRLQKISFSRARRVCALFLGVAVLSLVWVSIEGVVYIVTSMLN